MLENLNIAVKVYIVLQIMVHSGVVGLYVLYKIGLV